MRWRTASPPWPLWPGPLVRRIGYHAKSRLRRETCKRCWRESPVGFSVPDAMWRSVVPPRHIANVLCVVCFDHYATKRGVDWVAQGCTFFPVAGVRSSCSPPDTDVEEAAS